MCVCLLAVCLMCCKSGFYKRSRCHFCKHTKNLELTSSGLAGLGDSEPEGRMPRKKSSGGTRGEGPRGVNQIGAAVRGGQFLPVEVQAAS